jgi:hypothetical protein
MDPQQFALRLRLHKLQDTGVLATILLHELLQKQGKTVSLVQGYLTVMGETCWHVWIEDDKERPIDLGRILACMVDQEFTKCAFNYEKDKEKLAGFEIKEDPANKTIWEMREDKSFWKKAPKPFIEFRAKCHKTVSKIL